MILVDNIVISSLLLVFILLETNYFRDLRFVTILPNVMYKITLT